jgi:outer membrane receptor protein involved in Fe transport
MSKSIFKKTLLTSTVIAGSVLFATQAFAQDAPPQEPAGSAEPGIAPKENSQEIEQVQAEAAAEPEADSDIVVTGTRITNPNLVQSSPVTVIGEGEIQMQQVSSAEELLHELPGHSPSSNQNVNNGGNGSAFINLRGLGSNRNLVLLDGQRLVPVDLVSRTDLNQIPSALIERVDVFTGGASTVYGADAVAGVINFVTKRNFSGLDVDLGTGISERGDGALLRGNVTMGANFDDNRGNAVLSVGITETKPVYYGERPFSEFALSSATGGVQGSNTGVPVAVNNFSPAFTGGGQLDVGPASPGNTGLFRNRFNTYNTNPLNLLQTPLKRYNIFGKARYEISDAVEAYGMGMYTRSNVLFNAAPTGIFNIGLLVPLNNPFLTAAQRTQLCAGIDIDPATAGLQATTPADCTAAATAVRGSAAYRELPLTLDRRFAEAGPRVTNYKFDTFQGSLGLRGPLISNLRWDVVGAYGESQRVQSQVNGTRSGVQQALRASNAATCVDAVNAPVAGCVPLNIFGPEGSITPAMLATLVNTTVYNFVDTRLTQGQATIEGDFGYALPWATQPIGIAVGVEFRKYWGFSRGDAISAVPGEVLGAGAAALPQQGDYNSREAFGEMIIPIIEDKPFFHSLTLEVGGRYAHYDLSGGNWTYKAGGSWEPIPDIKFRAMYSKAVRAPNLAELFQPQVVALSNLAADPCQGTAVPANIAALCVATGVPASIINTGSIAAPSSGQIQTTQGGNPNLAPEVAKSFTAGIVLQPRMIPGFALTLDYFNIDVNDAITNPTNNDIIQGCYSVAGNPTLDPNNPFCQLVVRGPTGQLDGDATTTPGLQRALSNSGFLQARGYDLTMNYRRDVGFGRLSIAFNGNHTTRSRFKALVALPLSPNRECAGFYSTSCQPVAPRWSWTMRTTLGWLNNTIDTSLLWKHVSSNKLEPFVCQNEPNLSCGPEDPNDRTAAGVPINTIFDPYERIPAYDWFDFTNRIQATDHMSFVFTVQNLFNKRPPIVGNTIGQTAFNGGNTFPSNYDTVGRSYRVGVNLRF